MHNQKNLEKNIGRLFKFNEQNNDLCICVDIKTWIQKVTITVADSPLKRTAKYRRVKITYYNLTRPHLNNQSGGAQYCSVQNPWTIEKIIWLSPPSDNLIGK